EVLDYIVDETVQIHGGYGYSEEYPAARGYRDSRINRIFEGTNEINRLLTVDMLIKRSMKGRINLMGPAMAIQKELMSIPEFGEAPTGVLAAELDAIRNAKKAILMTAGMAVQKFMQKLADEQEIIMDLTDMLIEVYTSESAILRTQKLATMKNEDELQPYIEMTQAYVSDSLERINLYGKHAISAFAEGDELKLLTLGLKRFTKFGLINTTKLRRNIADRLIAANKYCF
ncbi:MAG: acyl-CoA dehydrogenase family protein, partial [Ignavibacteriaceae bacterium]|nr:acyl-CoA dehydrogenase family protein [Ignavibacteriaceae bacterium]